MKRVWLPGVSHDVGERPALQELHDHPQLVSHQVTVVHVHNVFMMIVPHDHHLQQRRMEKAACKLLAKEVICSTIGVK